MAVRTLVAAPVGPRPPSLNVPALPFANARPCVADNGDGSYQIVDRGSKCGCTVNERRIGQHAGVMSATLDDGDVLTLGTRESPYRFMFIAGFDNCRW